MFVDLNLDGMFDIVFYHDKKVYAFYNQHKATSFSSTLQDEQDLCAPDKEN